MLGQLICDVISMYRLGQPQLSLSEVDGCQMLAARAFDLGVFDISLRGQACDAAVAAANALSVPLLLLSDGDDTFPLTVTPERGLVVRKPVSEDDLRFAILQLSAVPRPSAPEHSRDGQA